MKINLNILDNTEKQEYSKKVREEMLKVLVYKGKTISFQYPLRNYKLILSEFWNVADEENEKNASWALKKYKDLYADEIENEQDSEIEKTPRYGLGLFGTIMAIIVGIMNAIGKKK